MGRIRPKVDKEEVIKLMDGTMFLVEVADRLGVSPPVISVLVKEIEKERGITLKRRSQEKKCDKEMVGAFVRLKDEEGITLKEIGLMYGYDKNFVYKKYTKYKQDTGTGEASLRIANEDISYSKACELFKKKKSDDEIARTIKMAVETIKRYRTRFKKGVAVRYVSPELPTKEVSSTLHNAWSPTTKLRKELTV